MHARRISFFDLVCLVSCSLVVLCITLMGVQRQRVAARGEVCANNLKRAGLASHNYHAAYKQFPMGSGGTTAVGDAEPWESNQDRLSTWVALLPFLEHQRLWEKIANPMPLGGVTFPPMGPVPWYDPDQYTPWGERPDVLVCPSERDADEFPTVASYTLNYGDAVHMVGSPYEPTTALKARAIRASNRGLFYGKNAIRFRDCLDGTSNTLMYSEACIANQPVARKIAGLAANPSLCLQASKDARTLFWDDGREACWADGCLRSVGFQTILPPNSPSCTSNLSDLEGVMSVSSYHPGGVHVVYADGAVRFVLDAIDAGKSDSPTVAILGDGTEYARPGSPSPYGLWGALGTRAARETIDRENPNIVPPPRELSEDEREKLQARPLQTWTSADGKTTMKARQVELQQESAVILLAEEGDVRRVLLSHLKSEDAYRAVQQHLAEKIKARAELKDQLQTGLKMLEDKRFEEFASRFIFGGELDPKGMARVIEIERGLLIYQFETVLRALDVPNSRTVQLVQNKNGIFARVQNSDRPMTLQMSFSYDAGDWKLAPQQQVFRAMRAR